MKYEWIYKKILDPEKPIPEILTDTKEYLYQELEFVNATCFNCINKSGCRICGFKFKYEWLKNKLSELQDFMKEYEVREIL